MEKKTIVSVILEEEEKNMLLNAQDILVEYCDQYSDCSGGCPFATTKDKCAVNICKEVISKLT